MHRQVSPRTRKLAREQRRLPTIAEAALWRDLRSARFSGLKFRRQVPIGSYIADFVCFKARLIVELDGQPHDEAAQRARDARRDEWLRSQGFKILRFRNEIINGGSGQLVLDAIRQAAMADPSSDPG